jgi:MFS family permease
MAFISAVFTADVIEPNLGECNIGFVMAANAAASALVSISIGRMSDRFGRPVVMGFAVSCIYFMVLCLRFFPPTSSVGIYGETNKHTN